jgi:NhaA family Na+:H+ antiporter
MPERPTPPPAPPPGPPGALRRFLATEAAGGAVLLAVTVIAVAWANTPWRAGYHDLTTSMRPVVNEGLMAVFFLVVGLEVKRELRGWRDVALPAVAAVGGMIVPALAYFAIAGGQGWGVPMATDIAFAVGALAVFGRRVPTSLKLFLLTLAVIDDVGSILVLSLFYAQRIDLLALAAAVAITAGLFGLRAAGVRGPAPYLVGGAGLWLALHHAGVPAPMAGAVVGLLLPDGERIEDALHPWVSFAVVPLFALANVGVTLSADLLATRVAMGVVTGRVLGKLVGITGTAWLAVRMGIGRRPANATWRQMAGVAALAAVGFTVPLLVADVALTGQLREAAGAGLLVGSVLGAGVGAGLLSTRF